jgi:uncharacterized protein YdhG (YjbR/CyaY superfamily)
MDSSTGNFRTIDEYIAAFPEDKQALMQELRATIKATAPNAEERISYQMPAFALNGNLLYFAALKNHIGFYPTSSGVAAFEGELSDFEHSKGAIKLPLDKPLPLDLIRRVVEYRVAENMKKAPAKPRKK